MITNEIVYNFFLCTQVEKYGRFRQKSTGNPWNVEAVFPPEIFGFSPMISGRFLPESSGN
jgi:hypothetical protein